MSGLGHRLWLSFWHVLPANPILVRVVHGSSRRRRHLWLRFGYLATLLAVVAMSLLLSISGQNASLAELAKRASQTFKYASTAQLALMCFLAPAFTAAAITQERDAQTYSILLSTPLSNAQIVLGSLLSRLYFVLLLLLAGLPIFLTTMVYGGVTTSQIVESFALSGATAVLTGAVAILIAMIGVGTRRTIFSFYLLIALYLLCVYLVGQIAQVTWVEASPANVAGRKMSWLAPLHPFLALQVSLHEVHAPPYERLGDYGGLVRYALAYPAATYVMWTVPAAFILTIVSMMLVRRSTKTGEPTWFSTMAGRFVRRGNGERRRPPRNVWNNPIAWREAKARAAGGGLFRLAVIAIGFAGPLALYFYHLSGGLPASEVPGWLAAILLVQFALVLIIATNTAATSMTREKESKTMDLLLCTTLTSKAILWGKLRGLVSFAMPLLAGPVLVLLLFGLHGLLVPSMRTIVWLETGVELAVLLVIYTAGACVLGLHVSLRSRKNVSAIMYSIGVVILISGISSAVGFSFVRAVDAEGGAILAPFFAPFTSIRFLVDPRALFDTSAAFAQRASAVRIIILVASAAAATFYAYIVWRVYESLVRNFDMATRKQSGL